MSILNLARPSRQRVWTEIKCQSLTSYDFDIDILISEIMKRKARRILIQLPDGLKTQAIELSKTIEGKTSSEVFLSSGGCYGGCDVAVDQARLLHADLIVHYGHSRFVAINDPQIVFLDAKSKLDLIPILKKAENELSNWTKIGLSTTIQHLNELEIVKEYLSTLGKKVTITPKTESITHSGQIIGCDYTPLKAIDGEIEVFLIIGSKFHGLGASIATKKPVILADPYANEVVNMAGMKNITVLQRYAAIDKARHAQKFAVILGTKPGQYDLKEATRLKKMLTAKGKTASIIVADEIRPDSLENFTDVQAFINTACPRIAIDDAERLTKPILLPREALVAIGELTWENILDQGLL